jgi:hypothetical protein
VNWVFTRFPIIPCNPKLKLKNETHANDSTSVHKGSPLLSATLADPLFHIVRAADMVNRAWINVPSMSQARDLHPILSPILPINAPNANEIKDVSAS